MSEIPTTRPDATELHWADGGTPNPTTEPSEGKKDDGFIYKDKPPAEEENWWRKRTGEIANYLAGAVPRIFTTLAEAIAATTYPDRFVIVPSLTSIFPRLYAQYNKEGEGGAVAVIAVRTDGERIYYAQGATVYAASPEDSDTILWSKANTENVVDLWADGRWVYVLRAYNASIDEIWLCDPTDGSEDQHVSLASPSGTLIRANGGYMCVAHGNLLRAWDGLGGAPNSLGSYDHGDDVRAVALSDNKTLATTSSLAFIGGDRGTSDMDLRAIKLDTMTAQWSVQLPTTGEPQINCIAADGERLYIGINAETIGSDFVCILVYSELDGSFLFAVPDGAYSCTRLVVDDEYIYATSSGGDLCMYSKKDGAWIGGLSGSYAVGDCDGLSIFGTNTANNCLRLYRGQASQMFQRVLGAEPSRKPFHKLAVPI